MRISQRLNSAVEKQVLVTVARSGQHEEKVRISKKGDFT